MRQFLRNLIFGDWLLKLFSLLLAVLTWLAVSDSLRQKPVETPDKSNLWETSYTDLPIVPVSGNGNVHDFKVKPSEVNLLTLQGKQATIQGIERRHIRVIVDLTDAALTNGLKRRLSVIAPPGAACIHVEPEEVEIIPPPTPEPAKPAP